MYTMFSILSEMSRRLQFPMRQGEPRSQDFPRFHLTTSVNVVVEHLGLVLEELAAVHLHRPWHYTKPELPWRPKTDKESAKTAKKMILGGQSPSKIRQE